MIITIMLLRLIAIIIGMLTIRFITEAERSGGAAATERSGGAAETERIGGAAEAE